MVSEGVGSSLMMPEVVPSAEAARGAEAEARMTGGKVAAPEVAVATEGLASSQAKVTA